MAAQLVQDQVAKEQQFKTNSIKKKTSEQNARRFLYLCIKHYSFSTLMTAVLSLEATLTK